MDARIAVFKGKEIRKTPKRVMKLVKGWGQIVTPLWFETEGIFRSIQ